MNEHQPGTWELIESKHGAGFRIRRLLDKDRQCEVIAQVNNEDDARLIAAAPDGLLLATLIVEYFGERPEDQMDTDQRLFDIATDLIAKAEGR